MPRRLRRSNTVHICRAVIGAWGNIGGHLIVYGHGLGQNDEHVLEAIVRSNVLRLSVSLYGSPNSRRNQQLQRRAMQLADRRHIKTDGKKPLAVDFFDAATASPWG